MISADVEFPLQGAADVITSAACGDAHSALLAASGAVFTAGCNRQGQCGQDPALQLVRVMLVEVVIGAFVGAFCGAFFGACPALQLVRVVLLCWPSARHNGDSVIAGAYTDA